jgi:hypothetical protein
VPRKPNPPLTDADQSKKFLETAKELDADKAGEAFKRLMGEVLPSKPKARQKSERS